MLLDVVSEEVSNKWNYEVTFPDLILLEYLYTGNHVFHKSHCFLHILLLTILFTFIKILFIVFGLFAVDVNPVKLFKWLLAFLQVYSFRANIHLLKLRVHYRLFLSFSTCLSSGIRWRWYLHFLLLFFFFFRCSLFRWLFWFILCCLMYTELLK